MTVEEMFRLGVTPKEGSYAGKRFEVRSLNQEEVFVCDEEGYRTNFAHGTYRLWEPPKTIFEDDRIEPTWGNLKKAVEAKGLSDSTRIITDPTTYDPFSILSPKYRYGARFRIVRNVLGEDGCDEIMVY